MSDTPTLVVGTAGHIDHGKSRLVLALTGTDPDRLPEEKSRGMTIDLGFAHLTTPECTISFVDVPGHERFIRNMVAGATGVDVAILVVAADDSVMLQTREHAEVLALLGVTRCLLALTKMDLVDDEWADQVEEEGRELLAALGIEPIGCVRTSAETGRGLDELRAALVQLARQEQRATVPYRWFRMPIDRSFSVPGRGTVVTGSVSHGGVESNTDLELWPAGRRVRVRDLQTHQDTCTAATGKMRLAMNLAAIGVEEVGRGHELATPDYLQPARCLDVQVASLRMPGKAVRQKVRLRLHIATSDVLAELRLIEKPTSGTCRNVFGQLVVESPVVASWGQPFILRDEAAARTLGGGRVLRPSSTRWTSRRPPHVPGLQILLDGQPKERVEEAVRAGVWGGGEAKQLATAAGLADANEAERLSRSLVDRGRATVLEAGAVRTLVHHDHLEQLREVLVGRLAKYLAENPRVPGLPRSEWPGWMPRACPEKLRPALAEWFITQGHVVRTGEHVVPAGHAGVLAPDDQKLLDALLAEFNAAAFQPPGLADLNCRTPKNEARLRELVDLATTRGDLARVADGIWLHQDRWTEAVERVCAEIRATGGQTVAQVRGLLDSSRKYMVPLMERFDVVGITRRQGDRRVLGPNAPAEPGG